MDSPAPSKNCCHECQEIEQQYTRVIAEIQAVVNRRFESVREKIRELHGKQDVRDAIIRRMHQHSRKHAAYRYQRKAAAKINGGRGENVNEVA